MDAALRILHNVLGTVDEDLEGVTDVQSEIGAQIETHWQTTVAMDDAHIADNIGIHGSLDVQRSATGRTWEGNRNGPKVLAVFERLVGLLSSGRYVTLLLLVVLHTRLLIGTAEKPKYARPSQLADFAMNNGPWPIIRRAIYRVILESRVRPTDVTPIILTATDYWR